MQKTGHVSKPPPPDMDAFSVYADGMLVSREWPDIWFIFAGYALVIGILFALVFKYKHQPEELSKK